MSDMSEKINAICTEAINNAEARTAESLRVSIYSKFLPLLTGKCANNSDGDTLPKDLTRSDVQRLVADAISQALVERGYEVPQYIMCAKRK